MNNYEIKLTVDEANQIEQIAREIFEKKDENSNDNTLLIIIADYLSELAKDGVNLNDVTKRSMKAIRHNALKKIESNLVHSPTSNEIISIISDIVPNYDKDIMNIIRQDFEEISK